jgi:hypothetical protein
LAPNHHQEKHQEANRRCIAWAFPRKEVIESRGGREQQEYHQVFVQKEVLEHYDARADNKQRRKRECDGRMHAACPHKVVKKTADSCSQNQVQRMKCNRVMSGEELQQDTGIEIEPRGMCVQIVQAFE